MVVFTGSCLTNYCFGFVLQSKHLQSFLVTSHCSAGIQTHTYIYTALHVWAWNDTYQNSATFDHLGWVTLLLSLCAGPPSQESVISPQPRTRSFISVWNWPQLSRRFVDRSSPSQSSAGFLMVTHHLPSLH